MKHFSDMIVVGGGPCGSFTALNLAKLGVNVKVFEEHGEIGVPSHCTGHLSIKGLKLLGLHPLPSGIVENSFYGAIFHSPKGKEFPVRLSSPVTCVVNRVLFDKHVAEMAKEAGADYSLNSMVISLITENDFVKGVIVRRHKTEEKFSAKVVVDAGGVSSRILRQAGLLASNPSMFVNAVQAEVENVKDLNLDMVEVFLGRDFMYKHPVASKKLQAAKLSRISFHAIPLGGSIPKTYSNGFLAVGDAASQVKPTTGGGVIFGMMCARVAAEVAYEALHKDDFSSETLSEYQRRCAEVLGFEGKFMVKTRRMLDALSDHRIDSAIAFCTKIGLDKTLQKVEDIDFQGRSLLHMLWNPRFSVALLYFILSYLSANP